MKLDWIKNTWLDNRYYRLADSWPEIPEDLRDWYRYTRWKWRKGKLTRKEIQLLEKIGVTPDKVDIGKSWEQRYRQLEDFQLRTGRMYPLYTSTEVNEEYRKLGKWVSRQRYSIDKLSSEQVTKLEALPEGWTWDARSLVFENYYQRAKRFYKKFGHLDVPPRGRYRALAYYLYMMRALYHKNRSKRKRDPEKFGEHVRLLSAIGMNWDGAASTRRNEAVKAMDEIDVQVWKKEWDQYLSDLRLIK